MRIFADFHHSGAAQGQVLLLHSRMSHVLYFPSDSFIKRIKPHMPQEGDWLPPSSDWLVKMGGVPDSIAADAGLYVIDYDEFMGIKWDVVLCTRIESQPIFKYLLSQHPDGKTIKIIAMTGNDVTAFDWDWVKNFMCCDELSYRAAPNNINKIWYSQEIGNHYGREFVPVTAETLKVVNSFVNCWPSFTGEWVWNCEYNGNNESCPHCGSQHKGPHAPVAPYQMWAGARALLPQVKFREYGINGEHGMIQERYLPQAYASGALTVHMKNYDGYGYSMLQSIACGRLVVVPHKFHRYRTANKYLIPNLTCLEAEWTSSSVAEAILYMTDNLERANKYSWACYQAAKGLFNWDLEAFRMKEFFRRLQ